VKSSLLKRSLVAGAVVATSVAAYIPMLNAASAAVISAAGSDTTENVMGSILSQLNTDANPIYNVPTYSTTNFTVPGDANCPTITFTNTVGSPINTPTAPGIAAPNGSGAGMQALTNFVASTKRYTNGSEVTVANSSQAAYDAATPVKGCVDIARSSGLGSTTQLPTTKGEYYAFALDAVSWASPSSKAPSTLTIDQLQKIYNCTYTNWDQVGGQSGPIQRYLPPTASGTRKYFVSDVLGFTTSVTYNAVVVDGVTTCPAAKVKDKNGSDFEENRGDRIPDADLETAILPYSAGQWAYQANNSVNPSIDQRKSSGGVVTQIGGINRSVFGKTGAGNNVLNNTGHVAWNDTDSRYQLNDAGWANVDPTPDAAGYPVIVGNTTKESGLAWDTVSYPGVRLVYNVLHTDSPNYSTARSLVGFTNTSIGTKSTLCSGGFATTISAFGFSPLTSASNESSNFPGSTCRKYIQ